MDLVQPSSSLMYRQPDFLWLRHTVQSDLEESVYLRALFLQGLMAVTLEL